MARVIAVFDDGTKADKARDDLETAGYGDNVHIVTSSGEEPDGVAAVSGSGTQGAAVTGTVQGAEPVMGYVALVDLSLGSEEEDFYRNNLDKGSQLMSIETDDPAQVTSLLEKAGASRVDTVS